LTVSTPGAAFGLAPAAAGPAGPTFQAPNPVRDEAHRLERVCHACGQWDTHPRHIHSDPANGQDVLLHLDCCAQRGCPLQGHPDLHDHACPQVLAAAPEGARHGEQLVGWLVGAKGKAHTRRLNEHADARKTVRVAREAVDRHQWEADQATANVENSQRLMEQAQRTLKGGQA
jgi:hypothetical protein